MDISFVIPCYRSESTIRGVVAEITRTMSDAGLLYEIILVNDHSPDGLSRVLPELSDADSRIRWLEFTRNFGQHAALMAGYRECTGEIIVSLDDDGQTPADESLKLIRKVREGADVAYASYGHKNHSLLRNLGSRLNDRMAETLIGKPRDLAVTSYFAMSRSIRDAVIDYTGPYPYVLGLVLRATSNFCNVPVSHRTRTSGTSGYTVRSLAKLWLNGFTAFSVKPLRFATLAGSFLALLGFLWGLYIIIRRLFNPEVPAGYSSILAAILFIGGAVMIMLGLVGEYVGRIYISQNKAPQYVIRKRNPED